MIIKAIRLFFIFFKIGLFTFGGGYSSIPMVTQDMISNGYLTETQITEFIGIAESTPGPFAINLATFAGHNTAGLLGAILATVGVVLPSFIVIVSIAYVGRKLIDHPLVSNALEFLKPVIVALVFATFINILNQTLNINFKPLKVNIKEFIIFISVLITTIIFKRKLTPVRLVILSMILGIIVYHF